MKKVLLFTSVCMMILVACSKDDDISSEIVGHWLCTSGTTTVYDLSTGEVNEYPYSRIWSVGNNFYFYDDGTCYYIYKGYKTNCTYKIRGNKIDIIEDGRILSFDIELSSKTMTLSQEYNDTELNTRTITASFFERQ